MSIKEKFYIREGLVVNGDTTIMGSATTTTGFTGSFTGSLTGIASTASFVNSLKQNVTVTGSLIVSGSGATIEVYGDKLIVGTVGGDEGGEILLGKPDTNNSLTGSGVTIDSYQNKLRFFEQGGAARGAYIDLTACAGGVGTNLISALLVLVVIALISLAMIYSLLFKIQGAAAWTLAVDISLTKEQLLCLSF